HDLRGQRRRAARQHDTCGGVLPRREAHCRLPPQNKSSKDSIFMSSPDGKTLKLLKNNDLTDDPALRVSACRESCYSALVVASNNSSTAKRRGMIFISSA